MTTLPHPAPTFKEALGAVLRKAREAARLSIKDVAREIDYCATQVSDVERGRRGVTRQMCDRLSDALGLDRTELYARAGHLSDQVQEYLVRRPRALALLERLAELDAPEEMVARLLLDAERSARLDAAFREEEPEDSGEGHAGPGDPRQAVDYSVMKQPSPGSPEPDLRLRGGSPVSLSGESSGS